MPTVKQLKAEIKQHNARNCIRNYSNKKKSALMSILNKTAPPSGPKPQKLKGANPQGVKPKKKIKPTLISALPSSNSSSNNQGGLTAGQKHMKKKVKKMSKKFKKLNNVDVAPELAF